MTHSPDLPAIGQEEASVPSLQLEKCQEMLLGPPEVMQHPRPVPARPPSIFPSSPWAEESEGAVRTYVLLFLPVLRWQGVPWAGVHLGSPGSRWGGPPGRSPLAQHCAPKGHQRCKANRGK